MNTHASIIDSGYAPTLRLPLRLNRGEYNYRYDYRIEGVDGEYFIHNGFVDPVTAEDGFSFSFMDKTTLKEFREARAKGRTLLATAEDYDGQISAVHVKTIYGRRYKVFDTMRTEVQVKELGRPKLNDLAISLSGNTNARWALEPPLVKTGDAAFYIFTPITVQQTAQSKTKVIERKGETLIIDGVPISLRE